MITWPFLMMVYADRAMTIVSNTTYRVVNVKVHSVKQSVNEESYMLHTGT